MWYTHDRISFTEIEQGILHEFHIRKDFNLTMEGHIKIITFLQIYCLYCPHYLTQIFSKGKNKIERCRESEKQVFMYMNIFAKFIYSSCWSCRCDELGETPNSLFKHSIFRNLRNSLKQIGPHLLSSHVNSTIYRLIFYHFSFILRLYQLNDLDEFYALCMPNLFLSLCYLTLASCWESFWSPDVFSTCIYNRELALFLLYPNRYG